MFEDGVESREQLPHAGGKGNFGHLPRVRGRAEKLWGLGLWRTATNILMYSTACTWARPPQTVRRLCEVTQLSTSQA